MIGALLRFGWRLIVASVSRETPAAPPPPRATVSRETLRGAADCPLCRAGCCGRHQRDPDADRARGEALAAYLPQVPRPWDPALTVETPDGRRPQCFGRYGYGEGLRGTGACGRTVCAFSDQCFAVLRQVVEARDSRAEGFNDLHSGLTKVARDAGEPSPGLAAMQVIQGLDVPMPFEDAVRGYDELGRLDSGLWAYCASCELVALKTVLVDGRCPACAPVVDRG